MVDVQTSQVRAGRVPGAARVDSDRPELPAVRQHHAGGVDGELFDVGGSTSVWTGGSLLVHGSVAGDSRTLIDGMVADAMFGNGQCSCVYDNENQTQEMVVQVAGGAAENQLSGVLVNRIPKSGGNTFNADGLLLFSNGSLQGNNVDDALRARGMTTPAQLPSSTTSTSARAGPSCGTGCGSSSQGATGPTTTMWPTRSTRTGRRR